MTTPRKVEKATKESLMEEKESHQSIASRKMKKNKMPRVKEVWQGIQVIQ